MHSTTRCLSGWVHAGFVTHYIPARVNPSALLTSDAAPTDPFRDAMHDARSVKLTCIEGEMQQSQGRVKVVRMHDATRWV